MSGNENTQFTRYCNQVVFARATPDVSGIILNSDTPNFNIVPNMIAEKNLTVKGETEFLGDTTFKGNVYLQHPPQEQIYLNDLVDVSISGTASNGELLMCVSGTFINTTSINSITSASIVSDYLGTTLIEADGANITTISGTTATIATLNSTNFNSTSIQGININGSSIVASSSITSSGTLQADTATINTLHASSITTDGTVQTSYPVQTLYVQNIIPLQGENSLTICGSNEVQHLFIGTGDAIGKVITIGSNSDDIVKIQGSLEVENINISGVSMDELRANEMRVNTILTCSGDVQSLRGYFDTLTVHTLNVSGEIVSVSQSSGLELTTPFIDAIYPIAPSTTIQIGQLATDITKTFILNSNSISTSGITSHTGTINSLTSTTITGTNGGITNISGSSINYSSGVIDTINNLSGIYTNSIESISGTLNILGSSSSGTTLNLATSNAIQNINIGTGTASKAITIGNGIDDILNLRTSLSGLRITCDNNSDTFRLCSASGLPLMLITGEEGATTLPRRNVMIGEFIGNSSGNSTPTINMSNMAIQNVLIGHNVAHNGMTTASNNTIIGTGAGTLLSNGTGNVAVGVGSMYQAYGCQNCIAIGANTGSHNSSGIESIYIGTGIKAGSASESYVTRIAGPSGLTMYLNSNSGATTYIAGNLIVNSSTGIDTDMITTHTLTTSGMTADTGIIYTLSGTTINYSSGVINAITNLSGIYTNSIESISGTLNILGSSSSGTTLNLATSNAIQNINIGTGTAAKSIQIGSGTASYGNDSITLITGDSGLFLNNKYYGQVRILTNDFMSPSTSHSAIFLTGQSPNDNQIKRNTIVGIDAGGVGLTLSGGEANCIFGAGAGYNLTSGGSNVAIGVNALRNNTSGSSNTALGAASLTANREGNFNLGIGVQTLFNASTTSNNIAIGYDTGHNLQTGSGNNTYLGNNIQPATATETNTVRIGDNVQSSYYIAPLATSTVNIGGMVNITNSGSIYNLTCPSGLTTNYGTINTITNLSGIFTNSIESISGTLNILGSSSSGTTLNLATSNAIQSVNIATATATGKVVTIGANNNDTIILNTSISGLRIASDGIVDSIRLNGISGNHLISLTGNIGTGLQPRRSVYVGCNDGYCIGISGTAAIENTFVGYKVADTKGISGTLISANGNVGIGAFCMANLSTGNFNTGIGHSNCFYSLTSGNYNTAIGASAGLSLQTGDGNNYIGYGTTAGSVSESYVTRIAGPSGLTMYLNSNSGATTYIAGNVIVNSPSGVECDRVLTHTITTSGFSCDTGSMATISGNSLLYNSGIITGLSSTSGTITNLHSTTGDIATLSGNSITYTTGTITGFSSTSGTISTVTSTNGTITNLHSTTGDISTLSGSSLIYSNGVITTLSGTTATITNVHSTTGDIATLSGNSITYTDGTITGFSSSSGTITYLTSSQLINSIISSTSGTITNLTSSIGYINNMTSSGIITGTITSNSGTITTLTSTTGYITNTNSTNGIITNISGSSMNYSTGHTDALTSSGITTGLIVGTSGTITNLSSSIGYINNMTSSGITAGTIISNSGNFNMLSVSGISTSLIQNMNGSAIAPIMITVPISTNKFDDSVLTNGSIQFYWDISDMSLSVRARNPSGTLTTYVFYS